MHHSTEHSNHHENHNVAIHHQAEHAQSINRMAFSATLHCIIGCATGEVLGLTVGILIGLSTAPTVVLAVLFAFLFGYSFSMNSLRRSGLSFRYALPIVLAADTLSIVTMELVDNSVMLLIPGAMDAGFNNLLYWSTMIISLFIAFIVALPVNRYLLQKGKGHALIHQHHNDDKH